MLPAPGSLHVPVMGGCSGSGAASASARLACGGAHVSSTPRARLVAISQPAPCAAAAAPSQHAQHSALGQPVCLIGSSSPGSPPHMTLPGLLHLRAAATLAGGGSSVAPRLRAASVRTAAAAVSGGAADSAPSPASPCTSPFTLAPGDGAEGAPWAGQLMFRGLAPRRSSSGSSGSQGLWPPHCHGGGTAAAGLPAGMSAAAALTAGAARLVLASTLPAGVRFRQLSTQISAGGGSGSGQAASKKQQKQAQKQAAEAEAAEAPPLPPPPASTIRFSPLHYNIEEFCAKVVLTEGEKRQRIEVIEAIRAGVRRVWPGARHIELQVFGSFANGLSTWSSDLDLVVTGVMEPDRVLGGYEQADRAKIAARLRRIADAVTRNRDIDILRQQLIPRARIPILKLWTKSRVCVDVSVSDESGPRAARYMAQQCRAFPPVKPLVLVLKTYLKACRLNEVNTGGLSSYSLTNMVIAHLQEELKSGHDISDLGETLYTFLLRYGEEHDYGAQAVSVGSGGIVPKMSLGFAMESARQAAATMGAYDGAVSWNERLFVDCPLTGRDVSNGTYRIDLVRGAFQQAARRLEAMAQGRRISDTSINYLQALFDVQRVLKRAFPQEQYEDEYLKVIGRAGDEEEREELSVGGDGDGEGERFGSDLDGDDLDGDYLERSPTTAAGAQSRR